MTRRLMTLLLVAAICGAISHYDAAQGQRESAADWVRTVDGWEPRVVLAARPRTAPPALHPAIVATLQLGASLFCLIALPTPVRRSVRRPDEAGGATIAGRRRRQRAAARC